MLTRNSELPPRMEDVARAAGVSKAAVSHVLNNRTGEVSAETRTRILAAIRDVGYRPAATRKLQARSQFKTLGFVITASADGLVEPSYFNRIFRAVLIEAEQREVHVTIFTGNLFDVDTDDKVRFYCDGRCDGLILCALRPDSQLPAVLKSRGSNHVLVGSTAQSAGSASVDVDHVHGIETLVQHLTGLGHRRIGFISGPEYTSAAPIRREAFRRAIVSAGLPLFDIPILPTDLTTQDHEAWVKRNFAVNRDERMTAVVCWNDIVAFDLIHQLRRMRYRVPSDLSVVGFDDSPEADRFTPGLTSYRQPYERLAQCALEFSLAQFENRCIEPLASIPGTLTVRGSTAGFNAPGG